MNAHSNLNLGNCCIDGTPTTIITDLTANPLKRVFAFLAERRKRRLDRVALRSLLSMDDNTLKDIGISRGDVQWASNLPLSTSATTELEILARRQQNIHRR